MRRLVLALAIVTVVSGCASSTTEDPADDTASPETEPGPAANATDCAPTADADFPDVVDVTLEPAGGSTFMVSATLCSAYDTPDRYADAWRVLTPSGDVLGVRELLHDHASEQPFTRSLREPIAVPAGVTAVVIEGRDQVNGWGGATVEVPVP